MHEQVSDPLVGAVIDERYLVRARLAHGGMSTVYLATDQRLDRDVAVKVMYPHLAQDPSFLERFRREARAAARLSHPHVVGVLDQGRDGRSVYLVMEYVPGHTLRDVLDAQGPLSPRHALMLLEPAIEGLAAAHTAGLVHRDIKPENVLIGTDGRVKIGDFGLARAVSAGTNTGTLIGTAAYLSPELVSGTTADERSDIYSAGIMLYEMLTGVHPFTGEMPIQVAIQHVTSSVPAPSVLAPGLAEDLDELVLCCTAADPDNRPVDANALLGELRHILGTLTDSELDRLPRQVRSAPGRPGHAQGSGSGSDATTVIGPHAVRDGLPSTPQHTELLHRPVNPTTVLAMPSGPHGSTSAHAPASHATSIQRTVSPRSRHRSLKALQKTTERTARRPEMNLRPGNPRRRGIIWLAILIIMAVLAGSVSWFFGFGPGQAVAVPELTRLTVAQAQAKLSATGLDTNTQDIYDDDVETGRVVSSDPAAWARIRKYVPVTLYVSMGPQLFPVPKLVGKDPGSAAAAIGAAKMSLGDISRTYSETAQYGAVLSQKPHAGAQAPRGTKVTLVVSKGPEPIDVPDVAGRTENAARQAVTDAGLKAEISPAPVFSKSVSAGSVVSQEPATGRLGKGRPVTLTISKGPRMIAVPDLVGKQLDEATDTLEKLGFQVEVRKFMGGFFGTVRAQEPVRKDVPEGTTITLTLV